MSDNLPVPRGGRVPARYDRKLAEATSGEIALVRAREDVATVKVEAVGVVGQIGLAQVAGLNLAEFAYLQHNPYRADRLGYIADIATYSIGRQIEHFERSLR